MLFFYVSLGGVVVVVVVVVAADGTSTGSEGCQKKVKKKRKVSEPHDGRVFATDLRHLLLLFCFLFDIFGSGASVDDLRASFVCMLKFPLLPLESLPKGSPGESSRREEVENHGSQIAGCEA